MPNSEKSNQPEAFLNAQMHVHGLHCSPRSTLAEVVETRHQQHALIVAEDEQINPIGIVAGFDIEKPAAGVALQIHR